MAEFGFQTFSLFQVTGPAQSLEVSQDGQPTPRHRQYMVGMETLRLKLVLTVLADVAVTLKCRDPQGCGDFPAKLHIFTVIWGGAVHEAKLLPQHPLSECRGVTAEVLGKLEKVFRIKVHEGVVGTLAFVSAQALLTGGADKRICRIEFGGPEVSITDTYQLALQCAGMKIEGTKGEAEYQILKSLIERA
jgi:hypothetical protein